MSFFSRAADRVAVALCGGAAPILAFVWFVLGAVLVVGSLVLGLDTLQDASLVGSGTRNLGYLSSLNWSISFVTIFPFMGYILGRYCASARQAFYSLGADGLIRTAAGRSLGAIAARNRWDRVYTRAVRLGLVLLAFEFSFSLAEYWHSSLRFLLPSVDAVPALDERDWKNAAIWAPIEQRPSGIANAIFAGVAFTAQALFVGQAFVFLCVHFAFLWMLHTLSEGNGDRLLAPTVRMNLSCRVPLRTTFLLSFMKGALVLVSAYLVVLNSQYSALANDENVFQFLFSPFRFSPSILHELPTAFSAIASVDFSVVSMLVYGIIIVGFYFAYVLFVRVPDVDSSSVSFASGLGAEGPAFETKWLARTIHLRIGPRRAVVLGAVIFAGLILYRLAPFFFLYAAYVGAREVQSFLAGPQEGSDG